MSKNTNKNTNIIENKINIRIDNIPKKRSKRRAKLKKKFIANNEPISMIPKLHMVQNNPFLKPRSNLENKEIIKQNILSNYQNPLEKKVIESQLSSIKGNRNLADTILSRNNDNNNDLIMTPNESMTSKITNQPSSISKIFPASKTFEDQSPKKLDFQFDISEDENDESLLIDIDENDSEDDLKEAELIPMNTKPCKCGSITHQRTSSLQCPLNKRNEKNIN